MSEDVKAYAMIKFGYSSTYILPFEDGIKLMHTFTDAEKYDASDYDHPVVAPLEDSPTLSIIPLAKYKEMRLKALINKDPAT